MKISGLLGLVLAIVIAYPVMSFARGQVMPPPRFMGGNIGAWIGDGGSGPIFGFDDPWGKDFPFGGGSILDPGFTGWLDGGDWTRGGNPLSGGNGNGNGGNGNYDPCLDACQYPSMVGDCVMICYCRKDYHGDWRANCIKDKTADWTGQMCDRLGLKCKVPGVDE